MCESKSTNRNSLLQAGHSVLAYFESLGECYDVLIMAYGSTPYVGMTPKKNGGHIQSAQMTRSKCPR